MASPLGKSCVQVRHVLDDRCIPAPPEYPTCARTYKEPRSPGIVNRYEVRSDDRRYRHHPHGRCAYNGVLAPPQGGGRARPVTAAAQPREPCARMLRARKALKSSLMNSGSWALAVAVALPADGLHERLPSGEPVRSQAARYASIARSAVKLCVPAAAGPPSWAPARIRPAASGRPIQGGGCRFRVGSASSRASDAVTQPRSGPVRWLPASNDRCRPR